MVNLFGWLPLSSSQVEGENSPSNRVAPREILVPDNTLLVLSGFFYNKRNFIGFASINYLARRDSSDEQEKEDFKRKC